MRQKDHTFFHILICFFTALLISGCFPKVCPPSLLHFPEKKIPLSLKERQETAQQVKTDIHQINQQKKAVLDAYK